jgi:hypothetical protein
VKAFVIADNRLTEISVWDDRLLAEQLIELSNVELDFELEATGFEMGEIDLIIEGFTEDSDRKPDPADLIPEQTGPRVARLGDVWELGRHRVLCGSALEDSNYAALMKAEKAASVFTDPPYNVRIEGNVSGLGKNRHRDFAMASGEMSAAEFTLFLTKALVLAAGYSEPGSLAYVCIDWRTPEKCSPRERRPTQSSKIFVRGSRISLEWVPSIGVSTS